MHFGLCFWDLRQRTPRTAPHLGVLPAQAHVWQPPGVEAAQQVPHLARVILRLPGPRQYLKYLKIGIRTLKINGGFQEEAKQKCAFATASLPFMKPVAALAVGQVVTFLHECSFTKHVATRK